MSGLLRFKLNVHCIMFGMNYDFCIASSWGQKSARLQVNESDVVFQPLECLQYGRIYIDQSSCTDKFLVCLVWTVQLPDLGWMLVSSSNPMEEKVEKLSSAFQIVRVQSTFDQLFECITIMWTGFGKGFTKRSSLLSKGLLPPVSSHPRLSSFQSYISLSAV